MRKKLFVLSMVISLVISSFNLTPISAKEVKDIEAPEEITMLEEEVTRSVPGQRFDVTYRSKIGDYTYIVLKATIVKDGSLFKFYSINDIQEEVTTKNGGFIDVGYFTHHLSSNGRKCIVTAHNNYKIGNLFGRTKVNDISRIFTASYVAN